MAPKRQKTAVAALIADAAESPPLRRSPRNHSGTRSPPVTDPKPPRKKAKTEAGSSSGTKLAEEASAPPSEAVKTIIIEHCKQDQLFKTRAEEVKKGLEKEVNVVVNPESPRKGCFEIREDGEGGEVFVSLVDMKRPFEPMKELDIGKVVSDIIEKIK